MTHWRVYSEYNEGQTLQACKTMPRTPHLAQRLRMHMAQTCLPQASQALHHTHKTTLCAHGTTMPHTHGTHLLVGLSQLDSVITRATTAAQPENNYALHI